MTEDGDARGKALVQVLAFVLEKMVAANADRIDDSGPITKFHALRPPSIRIYDYLMRIFQYASCSPECFVLSLIYIDRLIQRNDFVLNALNVHRVVITSVVLAAKFFDDQYFNNAYYARIGGVPCEEMNSLELEFLFLTNFSLHVSTDAYAKYYNELANHYVFANALHSYSMSSLATQEQQLKHYIAQDPMQDNQLVYITHATPTPSIQHHSFQSKEPESYEHNFAIRKCSGQKRSNVVALGVNA